MNDTRTALASILPKARFDDLIGLLHRDGLEVIGPRIEQQAIVYGPIHSAADLPVGWTDRQEPGTYRLEKGADNSYFGYAVGPHSWKKYLFPPTLRLWQARRVGNGVEVRDEEAVPPRRAFLGIRSCELHAIGVQDRVFLNRPGDLSDPHYARAREQLFLVAVECQHPAGTCFCVSMHTGPAIDSGRRPLPVLTSPPDAAAEGTPAPAPPDLILTELDDAFVVRIGSPAGQSVLERLNLAVASAEQEGTARDRVAAAASAMGRAVDISGIYDLLHRNQEHPRWDDVASRCLACTNCTLVCPTCFCFSVEDVTDLSLESTERVRRWDSCFNPDFAQVHGGNFRPSVRGRYRQWLTHKFASWYDQFGVSGCVGCGRCITWCPVGIDVTEEITAIRKTDAQHEEEMV